MGSIIDIKHFNEDISIVYNGEVIFVGKKEQFNKSPIKVFVQSLINEGNIRVIQRLS